MTSLSSRIAEKFKDRSLESKYLKTSTLYRLSAALLLLRKQRGITQKELADKVGTTQTVISRLESASVKPSLETILKVAEALDAAVDIRLLPVEKMRVSSMEDNTESEKPDPLKGILYYDWENSTLSPNAKWISPQNAPINKDIVAKPSKHATPLKRKIREYT